MGARKAFASRNYRFYDLFGREDEIKAIKKRLRRYNSNQICVLFIYDCKPFHGQLDLAGPPLRLDPAHMMIKIGSTDF